MKKCLNQRGSLPIVLIIVFVMTMSVVALTSLHVTEQINLSVSATKDVKRLYAEDSVREMTLHAFQQVLKSKAIEAVSGEQLFTTDDLAQLETLVNTQILPDYGLTEYQVFIEADYLPSTVDYFCTLEMDITGESPDGYNCLHEAFDIRLNVQIVHRNLVRQVIIEATNLSLETTEDKQSIVINATGATYAFKKK